jgi:acylphosphatase
MQTTGGAHVSAAGLERRTVYYTGRVQGVGFRYTAVRIAQGFAVTGYVKNLDDGRVMLVAEGVREELELFLARMSEEMRRNIRDIQVSNSPATGEFDDFGVEHE